MRRHAGFTLIELIMVMIIIGILAVFVLPRMTTREYRSVEFQDRVRATLRFAQKTAVSHRRLVCVTFTGSAVALGISQTNPASTCVAALVPPGETEALALVSNKDAATAVFTGGAPAAFFFQPDGRATSDGAGIFVVSPALTIDGQTIRVIGASGYVQ